MHALCMYVHVEYGCGLLIPSKIVLSCINYIIYNS